MFVFRKIWRALFSWNTRFEIWPFALLPTHCPWQLHALKYSIFVVSPFSKADVEEAVQEINVLTMDNDEEKLVDIE